MMTKPLAILKDSIREAWDSKILLVLIILSGLFALLLLSLGFTPVPAEDVFGAAKDDFPKIRINKGKIPAGPDFQRFNVAFEVKNFKELKNASNPANGEYQFTLTATPGESDEPIEGGPPRRKDRKGKDKATEKKDAKEGEKKDAKEGEKKDGEKKPEDAGQELDDHDNFGQAVLLWNTDLGDLVRKVRQAQDLSEEDKKKLFTFELTDRMMEDFVRERFEYHYNVKIKAVQRKPGPLKGPQEFDVVTDKSDERNWPHTTSFLFGAVPLKRVFRPTSIGQVVYVVQNNLVNGVGAGIAIILGVIITSFFIPNMLRKGSIDLMLAKPLHRATLLIYKYIGGMSFMFIFAAVTVGSVWVVLGIRSGLWNPKFLLLIPLLTFAFGILYAVSTLIAVLTRSAVASLLVTLAFSALLWILAYAYNQIDQIRNTPVKEILPEWVYTTADVVNGVLPRTRDLDVITTKLIADVMSDNDRQKYESALLSYPNWGETFGVSLVWIALLLGLACWRFGRRDF
jgi:ABC-type transport system involved in multi-copper enzyme maturation permease subunit